MNVTTVRRALETNLNGVSGLVCYDFIPDKPEPPCAIVIPDEPFAIPESMARCIFTYRFRVLVLVSTSVDETAQNALDGYLASSGTGSVFAALESDKTLGGSAQNSTVSQITTYGFVPWNDLRYWGAELAVNVLATG